MMAGLVFSVSVDTAVGCGYSCKLAYDFGCRIETPKTTSPAFYLSEKIGGRR
jgi:hypothetical protein